MEAGDPALVTVQRLNDSTAAALPCRSVVDAMLKFPDPEGGEKEGFSASEGAGGGVIALSVGDTGGGVLMRASPFLGFGPACASGNGMGSGGVTAHNF
jgi:hypothetical protein